MTILPLIILCILILLLVFQRIRNHHQTSCTQVSDFDKNQPDPVETTQERPDTSYLEQCLIKLLHGDASAAKRLIKHARSNSPGHSENWYYEKVISDLESDRR